jgi:hypothetical protein
MHLARLAKVAIGIVEACHLRPAGAKCVGISQADCLSVSVLRRAALLSPADSAVLLCLLTHSAFLRVMYLSSHIHHSAAKASGGGGG